MAWTYNTRIIREGRSWTDDNGITHPTNWGSWSDAEKISSGLTQIADPTPFDSRYYYSYSIPKPLQDSSDGTIGLITSFKERVTETERTLLAKSDWLALRSLEDANYTLDSDLGVYRSNVRSRADTIRSQLNTVTILSELISLNDSVDSGESSSFLNTWPEEY